MLKGQVTCRHCGAGALTIKLITALNTLVEMLPEDYDLIVHSGYRCARWNEQIGGSPRSRHMFGQAVDLHCSSLDVIGVYQVAVEIPAFNDGGIGIYIGKREWIHLDVRGYRARWAYKDGKKIPFKEAREAFGL